MSLRTAVTQLTQLTQLTQRAGLVIRDAQVAARVAATLADPYRPLMAHVVVTRQCNLSCGYCHEYDKVSPPVPTADLLRRFDQLARLKTAIVTLTGGESLLHPDIVMLVGEVTKRGMIPALNTNGFLLTEKIIKGLGEAGLFALQLSIDNLEPNETTVKSLRPLRPKLSLLAEHARFRVRINTVLGSQDPQEALAVAQAVTRYGFDAKCSLVRDEHGKVRPLSPEAAAIYDQIRALDRVTPRYLSEDFQLELIEKGTVSWKCRAGARYFTICEQGLVHLCESSHGNPGKRLDDYTRDDIARAFHRPKSCMPTCAVAYAHQASRLDKPRHQNGTEIMVDKRCWRNTDEPQLVQLRLDRRAV